MLDDDGIDGLVSDARQAHFADRRLQARLATTMAKLAVDPSRSFPKALTSAELEGAYRFFGNPLVTPDGILGGHFERTRQSAVDHETVLVVHDSSTFAFDPDGAREGLGRVRSQGQAFFAHVSLVLADDGTRLPLGLAALTTWVRTEKRPGTERARWAESVRLSSERLGGHRSAIHVMDREADDYALFARLLQTGERFVTRLAHDRLLATESAADPRKAHEAMATVECAIERKATLSKRIDGKRSPKQKGIHPARGRRVTTLSLGATTLTLKRPTTQDEALPESLSIHAVRVWEASPPEGEEPVEWILLTSEPVDSAEALVRTVDRYRARWTIEEYFKALKTGCAFPDRQLGDYEGLINALALFAPIACRLLALRSQAQHDADSPATRVLEPDEIEVLRVLGRIPLPPSPSARDVLLAVAALGGHIKWGGEPGWHTIGYGFSQLTLLVTGWRAAKLQPASDQR